MGRYNGLNNKWVQTKRPFVRILGFTRGRIKEESSWYQESWKYRSSKQHPKGWMCCHIRNIEDIQIGRRKIFCKKTLVVEFAKGCQLSLFSEVTSVSLNDSLEFWIHWILQDFSLYNQGMLKNFAKDL